MSEQSQRESVISAARSWLRTPYHHAARIKGGGADCLTVLAEIYAEAGIVPRVDIPPYSRQWHLHQSAELYLEGLLKYTREVERPGPGDIALWKFGRCFSHGAVVIGWPKIIHAYIDRCVTEDDAETADWLKFIGKGKRRPVRFFSPWGK